MPQYGTEILVSEETSNRCQASYAFRPVDQVRVKGKRIPIKVFTLSDGTDFTVLTQAALEAMWHQQWLEAEAAWQVILEKYPEDALAKVHLKRVEAYRLNPPPADWDGVHTATSK